jgi:uncharacterized protein
MKTYVAPISSDERISSIDVLRGFALLGILLVNILGFNASFFNFGGFYTSISDASQQEFYSIFISLSADKFILLFSFLFGYGIYMQYSRFVESKNSFATFFTRRMFVLSLFGIAHILFLWAGDILLNYSIAGCIVLLLHKLKTKFQIVIAVFFYFFIGIWLFISVYISLPDAMSSTCPDYLEKAKLIYASGNYFECLSLRLQEYAAFRNINAFYYLPKIIGLTLFGFIASKYELHKRIAHKKKQWFFVLIITSVIGVVAYFGYEKIVDFESPFANVVYMVGYEFMNLFIASSYLLLILILASYKSISKLFKPVALMGRMSLTNYLMQSFILSVIFYGWGFGLFGQTKVTYVLLIAIMVYAFQIVFSFIWFKFYQQGPFEKLWRRLSYGKTKKIPRC